MLAPLNAPITLERRTLHRVRDGAGRTILCLKGAIWLTQENDTRDIVLGPGESFILDRPGLAVLFALSSASVMVLAPAQARGREAASLRTAPAA